MFPEINADKNKLIGTFTSRMRKHSRWYKRSFKNPFVLTAENVVI